MPSVNLRFESGVIGHLTGSYDMTVRHPMERTEIGGTAGGSCCRTVYGDLWLYPHDPDEVTHVHNPDLRGHQRLDDTFRVRIHRFYEQIAERVPRRSRSSGSGWEGCRRRKGSRRRS